MAFFSRLNAPLRWLTRGGGWPLLVLALVVTTLVYWPGLSGSWLFDDFPNIVDNHGVQPQGVSLASLLNAALSSPASDFRRPLASLSFAANFLAAGLDPWWFKLTNVLIHLVNGVLVFLVARGVLRSAVAAPGRGGRWVMWGGKGIARERAPTRGETVGSAVAAQGQPVLNPPLQRNEPTPPQSSPAKQEAKPSSILPCKAREEAKARSALLHWSRGQTREAHGLIEAGGERDKPLISLERDANSTIGLVAALIAAAWLLLPINLTGVLYVVQRMESMANVFVLLGLLCYIVGRRRMLAGRGGLWLCVASLLVCTPVGILAKETAVMLPLYAVLVELVLYRFARRQGPGETGLPASAAPRPGPHAPASVAPQARAQGSTPAAPPPETPEPATDAPRPGVHAPVSLARQREAGALAPRRARRDWRILALFGLILVLPGIIGLAWLLPQVLKPSTWMMRDFTLSTRLLSEARIVVDYIGWTLVPTPAELSFYHDDFLISTSLLHPWTTLASIIALIALVALALWQYRRRPLVSLGIALFLGCHLLTGTIVPLELVYEHRNYFASIGLLLAVVPLLMGFDPLRWRQERAGEMDAGSADDARSAPHLAPAGGGWEGVGFGVLEPTPPQSSPAAQEANPSSILPCEAKSQPLLNPPLQSKGGSERKERVTSLEPEANARSSLFHWSARQWQKARYLIKAGPFVLAALFAWWIIDTASTAYDWGDDLRLARTLAERAPDSPRAQYELGRAYIIYSHNDPDSPYTRLAYPPLEHAAKLPDASILPEQALIFMNSHMHLPLRAAWWDSLIHKLQARPAGVQDESSLQVLVQCARSGNCKLPEAKMQAAFQAALSHPRPSSRVLATYSDYAWSVQGNEALGLSLIQRAIAASPGEPAYRITEIRMLSILGKTAQARQALEQLETLNLGGRLDSDIDGLRKLPGLGAG